MAIFSGNRRRCSPVKKNFLEECLANHLRSGGRSSALGSLREFSISSDISMGLTVLGLPLEVFCSNRVKKAGGDRRLQFWRHIWDGLFVGEILFDNTLSSSHFYRTDKVLQLTPSRKSIICKNWSKKKNIYFTAEQYLIGQDWDILKKLFQKIV